jgi:hypothetical protein
MHASPTRKELILSIYLSFKLWSHIVAEFTILDCSKHMRLTLLDISNFCEVGGLNNTLDI